MAFGACLVAGQLCAFLWPSALRFAPDGATQPSTRAFAFLAGAGLSQLVAQVVLTSAPVVLALAGGSPADVTTLFAAMALFRAPYLLVQGSVAPLTVRLTRLVVARDVATLARVRRGLVGLAVLSVPLAWATGAWLGPGLLRLVFGPEVSLAAHLAGLVAVGCALAVVNLLLHGGRPRPRPLRPRRRCLGRRDRGRRWWPTSLLSGPRPDRPHRVGVRGGRGSRARSACWCCCPGSGCRGQRPRLDRRQEHRRAERQVAAAQQPPLDARRGRISSRSMRERHRRQPLDGRPADARGGAVARAARRRRTGTPRRRRTSTRSTRSPAALDRGHQPAPV